MGFIANVKTIKPQAAVQLAFPHAVLLACSLRGGFPYVVLQCLLGAELLLLSIATIPLYPERGLFRHLWDLFKLTFGVCFVLMFLAISYGVVADAQQHAEPLITTLNAFRKVTLVSVAWAVFYIAVQLAVSLTFALRSDKPRETWARNVLSWGGATFVAMFFMVFIGFFVARPIVGVFTMFGLSISVDGVLCVLMVLTRYCMMLIVSTFSESEMREIANRPYVDGRG